MTDHYYDPEFHVISNTKDPSSFFASFSVFKNSSKSVLRYEERPPYPILTNKPTLRELLYNINKADVVLYFGIMGTGNCLLTKDLQLLSLVCVLLIPCTLSFL